MTFSGCRAATSLSSQRSKSVRARPNFSPKLEPIHRTKQRHDFWSAALSCLILNLQCLSSDESFYVKV